MSRSTTQAATSTIDTASSADDLGFDSERGQLRPMTLSAAQLVRVLGDEEILHRAPRPSRQLGVAAHDRLAGSAPDETVMQQGRAQDLKNRV